MTHLFMASQGLVSPGGQHGLKEVSELAVYFLEKMFSSEKSLRTISDPQGRRQSK
jgi:hypothetical protein